MKPWLLLGLLLAAGLARGEAPTLRYCDHPVYPPISWSDAAGSVQGVAPRAVREVAERLGLALEIVVLGLAGWPRARASHWLAPEGSRALMIKASSAC